MKELKAAITTFLSEAFEGDMEKLVESENESESQAIKDKTERVKREIQRILYGAFRIAVDMKCSRSLEAIGDQMKKYGLFKDLDNKDDSQIFETPLLQLVVDTNDLKTVGVLLDVGADIDEEMKGPDDINYSSTMHIQTGTTALHRAVGNNQIGIVQLLLDRGASTSKYDYSSLCPMDYAARMGNLEMVKLLYKGGAAIDAVDCDNDVTPMTHAVDWNQVHIVQFLLELAISESNKDDRDAVIGDALCDAALTRNIEMLKILLDAGADVNRYHSKLDETSLHFAARYGYKEIVEFLLKCNTDSELKNGKGDTPVTVAVQQDRCEIVQILFDHGACMYDRDCNEQTLIHVAMENRSTDMMELLLTRGAYIEGDGDDLLPLFIAVQKNYIAEAKLLIRWMVFEDYIYWEDDMSLIEVTPWLKSYQDECKKEMEPIKEEIIPETTMRYYDIVRIRLHSKRVYLTRNEIIVKAFESDNLSSKFPIFATRLIWFFERTLTRKKFHDQARRNFCSLYDKNDVKYPILPEEFTDQVFDCLRDEDLVAFCNARIVQS